MLDVDVVLQQRFADGRARRGSDLGARGAIFRVRQYLDDGYGVAWMVRACSSSAGFQKDVSPKSASEPFCCGKP
jgi:hypothetical protein